MTSNYFILLCTIVKGHNEVKVKSWKPDKRRFRRKWGNINSGIQFEVTVENGGTLTSFFTQQSFRIHTTYEGVSIMQVLLRIFLKWYEVQDCLMKDTIVFVFIPPLGRERNRNNSQLLSCGRSANSWTKRLRQCWQFYCYYRDYWLIALSI